MRGRPTLDPKHFRINLRINEDTFKRLNAVCEKTGISLAEYVRRNIDGNDLGLSEEEEILLKDIFNMASLSGMSREEFLKSLDNCMTKGYICVENGKLVNKQLI